MNQQLHHLLLLYYTTFTILIQPAHGTTHAHDEEPIENERPFLTRDMVLFGYRLPITPITLIILFLSIQILYSAFSKPTTAIASHILIDDHSPETQEKMKQWKEELKNDAQKFAHLAKEVSTCPSGKSNGGHLGRFKLGDMVPPFDKAVFSPKNDVGQVIGPIHTQFGWHLILIHERDEQRSMVVE